MCQNQLDPFILEQILWLGTVCLTLCEVLNLSTLSKDDLNPFYFLSHTLAFHSQLLHVLPLPRINLCNAPL